MTRCILPELCEIFKIAIGIFDHKGKRKLPRSVKQEDEVVYTH